MIGLVHLQNEAYLYCKKEKKKKRKKQLKHFHTAIMFQWQMHCSYTFCILFFLPYIRKKHTNIAYLAKAPLHKKKNFLLQTTHLLSENCLKLVMLKQSWKSSNYQIKNRKVNCYSSSTGLKQWSCIKGNFTVNAMEVCQKIIVHTCSF